MNLLRHLIRGVLHAAGQDGGEGSGGDSGAVGGDAGGDDAAASAAVEQRARQMGWAPKEQWRGNPNSWIDAKAYVERGEQVMPILQANLRKSEATIASQATQLRTLETRLNEQSETIQILTNISSEDGLAKAKEKRRELLRQQAQARSDNDTDLEIELGEQIADVTSDIKEAETAAKKAKANGGGGTAPAAAPGTKPGAKPTPGGSAQPSELSPEYKAWVAENPWFEVDIRKTSLALGIAQELRQNPTYAHIEGKAFFDLVTQELNRTLTPAARGSKVEGGGNGGGGGGGDQGGGGNGKSYADLPADAKAACERQAQWVVGDTKTFKDINAWRKHYVTMYFNS